jgi:hypothetical protein
MSYHLVIKPFAEKDIEESYKWYNQERERLADIFWINLREREAL